MAAAAVWVQWVVVVMLFPGWHEPLGLYCSVLRRRGSSSGQVANPHTTLPQRRHALPLLSSAAGVEVCQQLPQLGTAVPLLLSRNSALPEVGSWVKVKCVSTIAVQVRRMACDAPELSMRVRHPLLTDCTCAPAVCGCHCLGYNFCSLPLRASCSCWSMSAPRSPSALQRSVPG